MRIEIAGQAVTVSVQDEFGRIDLNAAGEATLATLFRSLGETPESPRSWPTRWPTGATATTCAA